MYNIGIDLGTTSIKVCVVQQRKIIAEKQRYHDANIPVKHGIQDAKRVISTAIHLIEEVWTEIGTSDKFENISITGQMHGIVCWSSGSVSLANKHRTLDYLECSDLYTWMYINNPEIVNILPKSKSYIHDGFGARTLLELLFQNHIKTQYNRCGTIMDLLACVLIGIDNVITNDQLAVSWGYTDGRQWEKALIDAVQDKIKLPVISDEKIVGKICNGVLQGLHGIDVMTPLGDLQASIKSVQEGLDEAYMIIGTSAQLCLLTKKEVNLSHLSFPILSYTSELNLMAHCAMNGGNAIDIFLEMLKKWTNSGVTFDVESLLKQVDEEKILDSSLQCDPGFLQERGEPYLGANLSGLKPDTSLVEILSSICSGVVHRLFHEISPIELQKIGIKRILLVGSARKPHYAKYIKQLFENIEIDVVETKQEASAAYGAAIFYEK